MVSMVFYFSIIPPISTFLMGKTETKPFLENSPGENFPLHASLCLNYSFSKYLLIVHYVPGKLSTVDTIMSIIQFLLSKKVLPGVGVWGGLQAITIQHTKFPPLITSKNADSTWNLKRHKRSVCGRGNGVSINTIISHIFLDQETK